MQKLLNILKQLLMLYCTICCLSVSAQQKYGSYVNPMLGSQGQGNVLVGPCYPFGMVKPGPDCGNGRANSGYLPNMVEPV